MHCSCIQCSLYFRYSFSGKLVNALLSGLSDRSAGVRKAYAGAAGHLVKVTIQFVLNSSNNYITLCVDCKGSHSDKDGWKTEELVL